MTPVTFTLRRRSPLYLDLSVLIPERIAGMPASRIKTLKLNSGRRRLAVGDVFDVRGKGSNHVVIAGNGGKFLRIGCGMSSGTIEVTGQGGRYVGQQMTGGRIVVRGDCEDWTGCGMKGGSIQVEGNTGDFSGAPLPGETGGMENGSIFVRGSIGDRAGDRMRSGMILAQGGAGDYTGSGMKAGTIIVLGSIGRHTGMDMRRGTIVLARRPRHLPPTFASCGTLKMEFLRLLFKELASFEKRLKFFRSFGPEAQRFAGDQAASGKGEILVLLNAVGVQQGSS